MEYEDAISVLRDILRENIPGHGSLAFSGGLDSTLLMHLSGYNLNPYTVGFRDSHDIKRSEEVSNILGFRLHEIYLDDVKLEDHVEILKNIDGSITRSEIGYELVLSVVLSSTDDDAIVTGQGADELFYGYRRTIESGSNEDQWRKLIDRTLPREKKIAEYYGKEIFTPYLNEDIVRIAMSFDSSYHIRDGQGKAMIRDAARSSGLPEQIYGYKKKAAQYGSGIDRYLKRVNYFSKLI